MTDEGELFTRLNGCAAVVTLNRPRALNALTRDMRNRLAAAMPVFARDPQVYAVIIRSTSERAFSAGSDVREFIGIAKADRAEAERAFAEEYQLNWLMECFSKPTISFIDGMVMGGGVGISQFGTHRVAGANYSWAMPETLIGFYPDVGAGYALSRLGEVGLYLGLTGRSIGRADAFRFGLATHCMDAEAFAAAEAEVARATPVDPVLDELHKDPGEGELERYSEVIGHAFSAATVEEIIARLKAVNGANRDWAQGVASDLQKRSPTSLKVTQQFLREARALDIRGVLMLDHRLACNFLAGHDFYEGVRAAILDKDGAPAWSPARLDEVTNSAVQVHFGHAVGGEAFYLPLREEMQKARV